MVNTIAITERSVLISLLPGIVVILVHKTLCESRILTLLESADSEVFPNELSSP